MAGRFYIGLVLLLSWTWSSAQHFVPNLGQWEGDFAYKWQFSNGAVFIEESGATFNLVNHGPIHHNHESHTSEAIRYEDIRNHAFHMDFSGSSTGEFIPLEKRMTYHNYILGKNPGNWKSKVPLYGRIRQAEIYPGIAVEYYERQGSIKYDLIVEPGADPGAIRMKYTGLDRIYLEEGYLIMETTVGEIIDQKPIAWQVKDGQKIFVECNFELDEDLVSFRVKRRFRNLPLIIDPQYIFSTYSGSYADNFGYTACFDSTGNLFGGGIAFGTGYPTTLGAFQDTFQGGSIDVAISKFNTDGTQLIYSTYIGGSRPEQPHSMVASKDNGLVIMGITGSSDFPVTPTALDTSFNGGPQKDVAYNTYINGVDMFVIHLDSTGGNALGSTFIGGTETDGANLNLNFNYGDESRGEVIYDSSMIYVASCTHSVDFMGGSYGTSNDQKVALFSLNNDCSNYLIRKVVDGSGHDAGYALRVIRDNGNAGVVVAGGTKSNNFPVSQGAYQGSYGGGWSDGIIFYYDPTLDSVLYSTYNGTNQYDQNFFIETDYDNKVYVLGQTKGNYPTTSWVWKVPGSAQFIQKFSSDLTTSHLSTTFGDGSTNTVDISPTAFMVDACRNVYLSGWGGNVGTQEGSTAGLPVTPDAQDSTTDGNDFYFFVMDGSWKKLEYASFFGQASREHVDGGTSRFRKDGTIFQAICAGCSNQSFPIFPSNVYSTTNNSNNCNLGCTKIEFSFSEPDVNIIIEPDSNCVPYNLAWIDSSVNVDVMYWDFGDGTNHTGFNPNKVFTEPGTYTLTIIGTDTLCNSLDTQTVDLFLFDTFVSAGFITKPIDTCSRPFTVELINTSSDSANYAWYFGDGNTSTDPNPTHVYGQQGEYVIMLIVYDKICARSDTARDTVFFKSPGTVSEFTLNYDPCGASLNVSGVQVGSGFQVHNWDLGDGTQKSGPGFNHTYAAPGSYKISLTSIDTICNTTAGYEQMIYLNPGLDENTIMPNVFTPNGDQVNDHLRLTDPSVAIRFSDFRLEIYNRWGTLVYATSDPAFEWDATVENGEISDGVYYWLLSTFDVCLRQIEFNGVVHIIR